MLGVRETEAHSALLEALRYGVEAEAEAPDIPLVCELQVVYPVTTLRAVLQLGGESRSVEVCAEGFLRLEEACRGGERKREDDPGIVVEVVLRDLER